MVSYVFTIHDGVPRESLITVMNKNVSISLRKVIRLTLIMTNVVINDKN